MEYKTLNNGVKMPMLGYGVYQVPPEDAQRCVSDALAVGYRLIDTAQAYENEEGVGAAIAESGIPRDEVFITSKVWVANMNYERAAASIDDTLRRLGTDYIDLMLLHQVMADYPGAWRALEDAYHAGKIRAIGVSNCYPERLVDLCTLAEVPPAVNQIETHPFLPERAAHDNMADLGVAHEAWAPFAEGRNDIFHNLALIAVGERYGKTSAQVILRWLMQRDIVAIPKSTHRERMEENFDVFDFELSADDMAEVARLEDPSFSRIFDHFDVGTIKWMLSDLVKRQQLHGATLY